MITHVDTSSLLKLVIEEAGSDTAEVIWDSADAPIAVGLIVVESRAALTTAAPSRQEDVRPADMRAVFRASSIAIVLAFLAGCSGFGD
ncbi:MAG: hypothetical protein RIE08_07245 [Acidimicrobiales bacterium]